MRKLSRKLIILISVIATLIVAAVTVSVYAAITATKARGQVEVTAMTFDVTSSFQYHTGTENLTFTEAKEQKKIEITTNNNTANVLHMTYTVSYTGTYDAAKAILVYFNLPDDATAEEKNSCYVGTLAEINGSDIKDDALFLGPKLSTSSTPKEKDTLTFEFHQGAASGLMDNASIPLTITAYTENADYLSNIYVSTEAEFQAAVDDINSGILDPSPMIVLVSDLTLNSGYEITSPVTIDLNGYDLDSAGTGAITLNSSAALLEVTGSGSFEPTVTLSSYDVSGALALVSKTVEAKLGEEVSSGTKVSSLVGNYSFYNVTIKDKNNKSYLTAEYTAPSSSPSSVEYFVIADKDSTTSLKYEFSVIDSSLANVDSALAHIPSDGTTVVTTDLFLPTSIPSSNASISWKAVTTKDETNTVDVMDDNGNIIADYADKVPVTLYAEFVLNNQSYTKVYSFRVSAHNNEMNFLKLVQEISPVILYNKYESDTTTAYYYLPVVSGTYAYTGSYKSPSSPDVDDSNKYQWTAQSDIDLESITYSLKTDSAGKSLYDFISIDGNAVYLNKNTLDTYAKITVTGKFNTEDRYYTSDVNVSISIGSDTQLVEAGFTKLSEYLADVDVLYNILKTRLTSGMLNESGDFTLPARYTNEEGDWYKFEYSCTTGGIIDSISALDATTNTYTFHINPEKFKEYETEASFTVTVKYKGSDDYSKSRTMSITVPAALHTDDFGTISIFNSVKYQVINQLPTAEIANSTGFSTSGNVLTNNAMDYILIRDIVGDSSYIASYLKSGSYYEKLADLESLAGNTYELTDVTAIDEQLTLETAAPLITVLSNNQISSNSGIKALSSETITNSTATKGIVYQDELFVGTVDLFFYTPTSDMSSATDSAANNFVKLIEWATSEVYSGVAASEVVSSGGTNYAAVSSTKSDGQSYLTSAEQSVLQAYYNDYCNNGWSNLPLDAIFSESAGYVYSNSKLVELVLTLISKEAGSTSYYAGSSGNSFGQLYGKYTEITATWVNAVTSNPSNAGCSEIYGAWEMGKGSYAAGYLWSYDSSKYSTTMFTDILGNTWGRSSIYGGTNEGTSNGYAKTSYNYQGNGLALESNVNDGTSYISDNELEVLENFWLNGLDGALYTMYNNKNTNAASSDTGGNVVVSFSSSAISSIATALQEYAGYENSTYAQTVASTYFATMGQALISAYEVCLVKPIYLSNDGIQKLVQNFYSNYGGTGYKLTSYSDESATSFNSSLISPSIKNELSGTSGTSYGLDVPLYEIPVVTNLDNIGSGLSYFSSLRNLYIYGSADAYAFLSDNALSQTYTRLSINNTNLQTLVMEYVAHSKMSFDLTNIKNSSSVKYLDFSNNDGITSVNELVNNKRSNYQYVDIYGIDVTYEYMEFAIDNIASSTCTVYFKLTSEEQDEYEDSSNLVYVDDDRYYSKTSLSSVLANLSDFSQFASEYLYATNIVYDDSGNATTIRWRIEEGNSINTALITEGGKYPAITSVSAMDSLISPYYYCTESFSYSYGNQSINFESGYVYQLYYYNSNISFRRVGECLEVDSLIDEYGNVITNLVDRTTVPDTSDFEPEIDSDENATTTSLGTIDSTYDNSYTYFTGESSKNTDVTLTFNAYRIYYKATWSNYYLNATTSSISYTTTQSSGTAFFFLTSDEASAVINKSYTSSQTLGHAPAANASYYMCFINSNTLYFVGSGTYTSGRSIGVTTDINSTTTVTISATLTNTSGTLKQGNVYLRYDGKYNNSSQKMYASTTSATYSYSYVTYPNIKITYNDGTITSINVSALWYDIIKTDNVSKTYTEIQQVKQEIREGNVKYYYYTSGDTSIYGNDIRGNSVVAVTSEWIYGVTINENGTTTPISRSREYYETGSYYELELWYTDYASGSDVELDYLDVSSIQYTPISSTYSSGTIYTGDLLALVPENSVTYNVPDDYPDWESEETNALLTGLEFQYYSCDVSEYISYVSNLASNNLTKLETQIEYVDGIAADYAYKYRYTGSNGSEIVYVEGTPETRSYSTSYSYQLAVNSSTNLLSWSQITALSDSTSSTTMDSILATANTHFNDSTYGSYYGMYYGYNGSNMYISSGIYVKKGYVYRIMVNEANTAFIWVEIGKYNKDGNGDAATILQNIATGVSVEGDIFYVTSDINGFYQAGWYKAAYDESTNSVSLVQFSDLAFNQKPSSSYGTSSTSLTTNTNTSYTMFWNRKIVSKVSGAIQYWGSNTGYLGFSGTYEVVLSAIYTDANGLFHAKKYKIKLVGNILTA